MARRTVSGVNGTSTWSTSRASHTAPGTAGGPPVQPAAPAPLGAGGGERQVVQLDRDDRELTEVPASDLCSCAGCVGIRTAVVRAAGELRAGADRSRR